MCQIKENMINRHNPEYHNPVHCVYMNEGLFSTDCNDTDYVTILLGENNAVAKVSIGSIVEQLKRYIPVDKSL